MVTRKLKTIFGISIFFFVIHGIEEFVTHFYDIDSHDQAIFGLLNGLSNHGATFVVFQIMFWLLLIVSFLLLLGEKWQFRILAISGVVYVYELHHIIKAIQTGGYYPGLYTALAFPIIGFLFWKEWIKIYRNK